jgi:hypothetical protein
MTGWFALGRWAEHNLCEKATELHVEIVEVNELQLHLELLVAIA